MKLLKMCGLEIRLCLFMFQSILIRQNSSISDYNRYFQLTLWSSGNACALGARVLWFNSQLRQYIFSSPEHEVLKWAFVILQCPASVRPSVRPSVRASTISLNNISSETSYWILTKLHRNDPWVVLYQSCSNRSSWLHK